MSDNVIDIAARRAAILDYLRDGPYAKRDVIDKIGCSRSTVDRALEELTDAELVDRSDGKYEATLIGVLALQTRRAYESDARALRHAGQALKPLWKEAPIEPSVLRDAEITLLEEPNALTTLSDLQVSVDTAGSIRALLPAVSSVEQLKSIHSRADGGQVKIKLVCSDQLFEYLRTTHPRWLRDTVLDGEATLRTASLAKFGLLLLDTGVGPTVWLMIYDQGRLHAVIKNTTVAAIEWARDCFEQFWRGAVDRGDAIEATTQDGEFTPPVMAGPVGGDRIASASGTARIEGSDDLSDDLLGGGYAIDHSQLRTPEFGTEDACTVALWFKTDGFDTDWETLIKWDYVTLGYRRGQLFGHVFDPEREQIRARVDVPVEQVERGQWQHVAYGYDESRARLYLDGALVDETEDSYPLVVRPLGACLGYIYRDRDTGVHTPEFHGQIADARFYETRLDPGRIERLYRTTDPRDVHLSASRPDRS